MFIFAYDPREKFQRNLNPCQMQYYSYLPYLRTWKFVRSKINQIMIFLKKGKKIFEWLQNLNLFSVNKQQTKDRKLSFLAAELFIITFQIQFWLFFYKWLLQFDQIDNNGVKACIKFESIKIIFTCLAYFLPPRIATGTGIN